jgi:hypothetical protein
MTSRYSDGLKDGGNPHTKFYSSRGFKALFKQGGFSDIQVTINHATAEWQNWPMQTVRLGWLVPKSAQCFLSTRFRWGLGASITAIKK